MPQYVLSHARELSQETKQTIASAITKLHCEHTSAPAKYVQVMFVGVEGFSAGEHNLDFINLDATIRPGRPPEVEKALLWDLDSLVKSVLAPARYFITLSSYGTPYLVENGQLLPEAQW